MANRGEVRVFVPRDTTARSLGADDVAQAIAGTATDRGESVALVRSGSRGLYWLEPLVEVEVDGVRHAYGPIGPGDVEGLFDAGFLTAGDHANALGPTGQIPYLARQRTTGRMAAMRGSRRRWSWTARRSWIS